MVCKKSVPGSSSQCHTPHVVLHTSPQGTGHTLAATDTSAVDSLAAAVAVAAVIIQKSQKATLVTETQQAILERTDDDTQ